MADTQVSKRMRKLSTDQLKRILTQESKDYTKEALAAARQELETRGEGEDVPDTPATPAVTRPLPTATNTIGVLLRVVGFVLLAVGLVVGVLLYGKTKLLTTLSTAGGVMATGLLFLGVSEAIKLLMELKERSDSRPQ